MKLLTLTLLLVCVASGLIIGCDTEELGNKGSWSIDKKPDSGDISFRNRYAKIQFNMGRKIIFEIDSSYNIKIYDTTLFVRFIDSLIQRNRYLENQIIDRELKPIEQKDRFVL